MGRSSTMTDAPFDPRFGPSLRNWEQPSAQVARKMKSDVVLPMGWGRLIFGHTFSTSEAMARTILQEAPGKRDIAFYLRDPHVVLSLAPSELFLDPSHTYRLWLHHYRSGGMQPQGFTVRRVRSPADVEGMNRIYNARNMVPVDPDFVLEHVNDPTRTWLVAEDTADGEIVGTVTGIDHVHAFNDPEKGASLWCLAVDPQAPQPGVGQGLVRRLIERYVTRGRGYVDLSVMHDNTQAISLYEKLGFERVPVFCVKKKNAINEPLFIGEPPEARLNPYAAIIVNEARRRGILVDVLDEEAGYFSLHFGGRSVVCRESLTELTTAIAMSRCDDKRVTLRCVRRAGLRVPDQQTAGNRQDNLAFLEAHEELVVKPARGEQGAGITVGVKDPQQLEQAIETARRISSDVLLEQRVQGDDLRIVVINYEVVAAAIRKPAQVVGTGRHTVAELIEKQSRRRAAATGGESRIPVDEHTGQCVADAGYSMESILPLDEALVVRKTANLHTGGTIHDVTDKLHPALAKAAVAAARALDIPVTGLDFLVPSVEAPEYVIIEANERPGLANHEPQPTAEKFIDFLFPHTRPTGGMMSAKVSG